MIDLLSLRLALFGQQGRYATYRHPAIDARSLQRLNFQVLSSVTLRRQIFGRHAEITRQGRSSRLRAAI